MFDDPPGLPDCDELGLCWSCQTELDPEIAVWLNNNLAIQCCRRCWGLIPEDRRIEIALNFHDRSPDGLGIRETTDLLRDLIHETISGGWQRKTDEGGRLN